MVERTSCFRPSSIDTGTGHQDIVDDSEHAFTCNPRAVFVLDSSIVQDCSLVKTDSAAMDFTSKGDFIWVKVFPTRSARDFMREVSKDVLDRVGTVLDAGILGQI